VCAQRDSVRGLAVQQDGRWGDGGGAHAAALAGAVPECCFSGAYVGRVGVGWGSTSSALQVIPLLHRCSTTTIDTQPATTASPVACARSWCAPACGRGGVGGGCRRRGALWLARRHLELRWLQL